jgi:hypothetical protein
LLDREVRWFCALEYLIDVGGRASQQIGYRGSMRTCSASGRRLHRAIEALRTGRRSDFTVHEASSGSLRPRHSLLIGFIFCEKHFEPRSDEGIRGCTREARKPGFFPCSLLAGRVAQD